MPPHTFKPALSHPSLTHLYDPLAEWFFRRTALQPQLMKTLNLKRGSKVLELGCGPGRFAISVKKSVPTTELTALDIDPKILKIARANAKKEGVAIRWFKQDLTRLQLSGRYDRIYSSMVLHHLNVEGKQKALKKIGKLLAPRGLFVLADFCQTKGLIERLQFLPVQFFDGFETTNPHSAGWLEENLPSYFSSAKRIAKVGSLFGPLGIFVCRK